MKLLICGAHGQLGNELQKILSLGYGEIGPIPSVYQDVCVVATDADELDVTDQDAVLQFCEQQQFDIIINAAAYTNVDACETDPDLAYRINAQAPGYLAEAAQKIGAKLVHVSTDYVFSGAEQGERIESDVTNPISVYGKTKLVGEERVLKFCPHSFIVRTAWLYGYEGNNFVKTMLKLSDKLDSWEVVCDQWGNPTSANDLAFEILWLATTDNYGIYHITNEGTCSWFDFAQQILQEAGQDRERIKPCTTEEYRLKHPESAPRPAYSSLSNHHLTSTIGNKMRRWEDALHTYMNNVGN